jgi:hypothetical protein
MEIYKIIPAKMLRETKNVQFHSLPILDELKGLDRVAHGSGAFSPGSIEGVERPWYMHPYQADNLIVFCGTRVVELYKDGEMVRLEVTPEKIVKDGETLFEGPALLCWGVNTFHRIQSGIDGSMSLNFAQRYEGFDIKNNFNIYDLDTDSGEYKVIREGWKDQ